MEKFMKILSLCVAALAISSLVWYFLVINRISSKDWIPPSKLMTAVYYRDGKLLAELIKSGESNLDLKYSCYKLLRKRQISRLTPIAFASIIDWPEGIKILAAAGSHIDDPDPKAYSALSEAIYRIKYDSVQTLLDLGADPFRRSAENGSDLIHIAKQIGNERIVEALIRARKTHRQGE